ncbi:hypothetical protein FW778_00790 [Ginsengibacter hankyongi]|uniref:Sigma 54 modulation protein / S30EA ribosomal protein n=1 Tax=Ginsengibacter hankyongi TaxID=2607284 RepID=A0A5J5IIJ9_9BACT|nr:hypothetical protein [Ginsengibacter hankyongi]KAA9040611.1 hypothetical protein FW778_00790 [Ginsengibacter hankyongi]
MTIEFNTVYGKVPENLVTDITRQLIKLLHTDKKISRAEVSLLPDKTIIPTENKVCGIKLTMHGDDLVVQARAQNFKSAAKEAIHELKKLIKQQITGKQALPEEEVSTVRL